MTFSEAKKCQAKKQTAFSPDLGKTPHDCCFPNDITTLTLAHLPPSSSSITTVSNFPFNSKSLINHHASPPMESRNTPPSPPHSIKGNVYLFFAFCCVFVCSSRTPSSHAKPKHRTRAKDDVPMVIPMLCWLRTMLRSPLWRHPKSSSRKNSLSVDCNWESESEWEFARDSRVLPERIGPRDVITTKRHRREMSRALLSLSQLWVAPDETGLKVWEGVCHFCFYFDTALWNNKSKANKTR